MATQIHGFGPNGELSPGATAALAGLGGGGATALGDLTDVDTSGATTGQVLTFDGSEWTPDAPSGGGGTAPVLDVSSTPALWVVAPVASVCGSYSSTARLWTSTLMPYPMTVHGLGIYVTTADTDALLTVALYQGFSGTDQVARVLDPLDMDLSATGYVQVALDEPISLAHGPLWVAYIFSDTVARVRAGTNTLPIYRPGTTGVDHRQVRAIPGTGSLPASLDITTTSSPSSENPPALGLLAVAP